MPSVVNKALSIKLSNLNVIFFLFSNKQCSLFVYENNQKFACLFLLKTFMYTISMKQNCCIFILAGEALIVEVNTFVREIGPLNLVDNVSALKAEGHRPRNYWSCCWIFRYINSNFNLFNILNQIQFFYFYFVSFLF